MTDSRDPRRYRAELSGPSWTIAPTAMFATIREARRWAESYGTGADRCAIIATRSGHVVAEHRRDTSGDGRRWFRAEPAPVW